MYHPGIALHSGAKTLDIKFYRNLWIFLYIFNLHGVLLFHRFYLCLLLMYVQVTRLKF